jgi:hypothetical protein
MVSTSKAAGKDVYIKTIGKVVISLLSNVFMVTIQNYLSLIHPQFRQNSRRRGESRFHGGSLDSKLYL